MSPVTIVLIVLSLLLVGLIPIWSRNRTEGRGPGGALGLALFALPVLLLTGRL